MIWFVNLNANVGIMYDFQFKLSYYCRLFQLLNVIQPYDDINIALKQSNITVQCCFHFQLHCLFNKHPCICSVVYLIVNVLVQLFPYCYFRSIINCLSLYVSTSRPVHSHAGLAVKAGMCRRCWEVILLLTGIKL